MVHNARDGTDKNYVKTPGCSELVHLLDPIKELEFILSSYYKKFVMNTNFFKMSCAAVLQYYLLTYLLTPWCRVLLEKLTGLQLVK